MTGTMMRLVVAVVVATSGALYGGIGPNLLGGNSTALGTVAIQGDYRWTGGRVWHVPAGASIASYIARASAGDVLVLAAGTYTVTSTLVINKSIAIVGQGQRSTWIYGVDLVPVVSVVASRVVLSQLGIHCMIVSANYSQCLGVGPGYSDIFVDRVDMVTVSVNTTNHTCHAARVFSPIHVHACNAYVYGNAYSHVEGAIRFAGAGTSTVSNTYVYAYADRNTSTIGIRGYSDDASARHIVARTCVVVSENPSYPAFQTALLLDGASGNSPTIEATGCSFINKIDRGGSAFLSNTRAEGKYIFSDCHFIGPRGNGWGFTTPGDIYARQINLWGSTTQIFISSHAASTNTFTLTVNSQDTTTMGASHLSVTATSVTVTNGVMIGARSHNNRISTVSGGTGSTTLYIGLNSINTTAPSDARLKDVVGTADERKARALLRVPVRRWKYKDGMSDDTSVHTGFIAQEISSAWPEAIMVRSDGMLSVKKDELVVPLLMIIREQERRIRALEIKLGCKSSSSQE